MTSLDLAASLRDLPSTLPTSNFALDQSKDSLLQPPKKYYFAIMATFSGRCLFIGSTAVAIFTIPKNAVVIINLKRLTLPSTSFLRTRKLLYALLPFTLPRFKDTLSSPLCYVYVRPPHNPTLKHTTKVNTASTGNMSMRSSAPGNQDRWIN